MNRINQCLAQLADQGRKALVPYIVVGDPSLEVTVATMHELVKQGADILELGVAFSDPTAEGPVIQRAHERALAKKTRLRDALGVVAEFRQKDSTTPVVLMGYANPIERMGYGEFVQRASAAGVDGVLTVDLPPEEAEELVNELSKAFGRVDGAGDVKSALSKARRALKNKNPDPVKAMEEYEKAVAAFEAQKIWRAEAASLKPGLQAYLDGIAETLGARQQPRLSEDQALYLAACTAGHRDLSLNF